MQTIEERKKIRPHPGPLPQERGGQRMCRGRTGGLELSTTRSHKIMRSKKSALTLTLSPRRGEASSTLSLVGTRDGRKPSADDHFVALVDLAEFPAGDNIGD